MKCLNTELKGMRGLCDGSEYIDFQNLRKRLLVCISNAPSLGQHISADRLIVS
jgi:hypothetical protein